MKIIKKFFTDLFIQLYLTITIPDPCRRCIVRAMCSKDCDQRDKYTMIFGSYPNMHRLNAYAIIFGVVAITSGGLKLIFFK